MRDLREVAERAASRAPDAPFVESAEETLTFGRAAEEAASWAEAIRAAGVKPGDAVALLAESPARWAAAWAGIHFAGAVAVPLDPDDADAAFEAKLADSDARVAVAEGLKSGRLAERPGLVLVGAAARAAAVPVSAADPSRPAAVVFTSGSSGRPLGAALSHANLVSNARAVAGYLGLRPGDRTLSPLPFHYIYGLSVLLSHWIAGATLVSEAGFLYPQKTVDRMRASGCTGFSGVAFHFASLAERTDFLSRPVAGLRYLTHAGDRLPSGLARRFTEALPDVRLHLMYGQTEAGPRISHLDPAKARAKPESVGAPIEGTVLRIVREDGADALAGEEGEVVVKGSGVMLGYWRRPDATAEALRDGWLRTGDFGRIDADGDLFITGRRKRFLKVGGRTVHPEEIENAIRAIPGVRAAAVAGVPDAALGEKPFALVEWPGGTPEGVIAACRAAFPPFKVPAGVLIVDALPATPSGKIDWERVRALVPAAARN